MMLLQQCVDRLRVSPGPAAELLPQLQSLARALFSRKLSLHEGSEDLCQSLVTELLTHICGKSAESASSEGSSRRKSARQTFRDATVLILVRVANSSPALASLVTSLGLNHLCVCKDCLDSLFVLNAVCTHSTNARIAAAQPLMHNRVVELVCTHCGALFGALSLCASIKQEGAADNPAAASEDVTLRRAPAIEGLVPVRAEKRRELERSVQSESVTEDSKGRAAAATVPGTGAGVLRLNYYTNQTVTRSQRRQQNLNRNSNAGVAAGEADTSPAGITSVQNLSSNNIAPTGPAATRPSIPRLNINQLVADASPVGTLHTRSSRRADVTKSASTRSTKYSAIFSTSFDHVHSHSGIFA